MSQTGHNLENHLEDIGKLVREAYDLEGLRWLCLKTPEFRPVYDDISEETPKSKLARRLLEHCLRQGLLEKLVTLIEQDAPGRLHSLQLKEAKYGLEVPVSIQIEIEDLEAEIMKLKQKLADLSS